MAKLAQLVSSASILIVLAVPTSALAATDPATPAPTTPTTTQAAPTPTTTAPTSNTDVMSQSGAPTTTQSSQQKQSTVNINTTDYSGQVLKVSNDKLVIDSANGSKEFKVPANVKIQRNGDSSMLSEIKPGDKVVVKATSDGEVLAVSATAGSVINKGKYVLGILVALFVIAAIIGYLLRKRNKGFIKTMPTKV